MAATNNERGQRMIEAALAYREKGYHPIPIREGTKKARISWEDYQHRAPLNEEIHSWWDLHPGDNIAIVTGSYCQTVVVDADGPDGLTAFASLGSEPVTPTNLTGRGGKHFLYQAPDGPVKTRTGVLPHVDVRAEGGYIIVPPSIHHETGTAYTWAPGRSPLDVPLVPLPAVLRDLLTVAPSTQQKKALAKLWADQTLIANGARNDTLTRLSGSLIGTGFAPQLASTYLKVANVLRCKPPLDGAEVDAIVESIAKAEVAKRTDPSRNARTTRNRALAAQPVFQRLSEVTATQTEWLWSGYIPLGKVTLFLGDPALGKSTLTTDIAARLTAGHAMPDGHITSPSGVVLLTGEDGAADTVRPRFDAAGGNASRVLLIPHLVTSDGTKRPLSIPEDIEHLHAAIREVEARLVVLDPLVVYLSSEINSWNDQQVRQALSPLAKLAEETRTAVVIVVHLNKKSGSAAMYRSGGSIGIVAASRAAFLVAPHPDDSEVRVLTPVKFNLGPTPASRMFRIVGADNGSSRIAWEGVTSLTADQLLEQPRVTKEAQAAAFLEEQLADGAKPVRAIELLASQAGFSERTLNRARKRLGIQCKRSEFQGEVWMALLDKGATGSDEKSNLALTDDLATSSHGTTPNSPSEATVVEIAAYSASTRINQTISGTTGTTADLSPPACGQVMSDATYGFDEWLERAAIMEFDGGLSRTDAELAAGPLPPAEVPNAA